MYHCISTKHLLGIVLAAVQGLIILDRFLCITLKNNEIRNSLIDPANVIK